MKRYQFRLAAVLRLRHAEEEQAREALSAANGRLRARISERDAELTRYTRLSTATPATTLDGLRAEHQAAGLAAAVVTQARSAVTTAAADAALAQISWSGASRRLKVLERLDERRREEHAEDERRAEIATIDDIVTARYVDAQNAAEHEAARDAEQSDARREAERVSIGGIR